MPSASERASSCARRLTYLARLMEGAKGSQIVEAADKMREHVNGQWHRLADAGHEALVQASARIGMNAEDMGDLANFLWRHES